MGSPTSRLLFDPQDYELRTIVNEVLDHNKPKKYLKRLLDPYLHPNGIKELAAPKELRIAYAVIHLLGSLEAGLTQDRLTALRSLQDEVLHSGATALRRNTARVLLQIMKTLVRSQDDPRRQLELAHDFRAATSGKPRIIREQLHRYHLLEMPEEWNQMAFDDHVHDASTKGRKTPTHLVMDAWIKGQRYLTVVYYNYVGIEVAQELLEAGKIMGVKVNIGIEYAARFRGQFVRFIWTPTRLSDPRDFSAFMQKDPVREFMEEGHEVSSYRECYVLMALRHFNEHHRHEVNEAYNLALEPLSESGFLDFVGKGQTSMFHLTKYVFARVIEAMSENVEALRRAYREASSEDRAAIRAHVEELNCLTSADFKERFLHPPPSERRSPAAAPKARRTEENGTPLQDRHGDFDDILDLEEHAAPDELAANDQGGARDDRARLEPEAPYESGVEPPPREREKAAGSPPPVPVLLTLTPHELLSRLTQLPIGYRITLNVSNLSAVDVVELLYDCQGIVTHLEIFNLKDYAAGMIKHNAEMIALQRAINEGNIIQLKKMLRGMIERLEESEDSRAPARIEKLTRILFDLPTLKSLYKATPLKARIGSDSTGRSRHLPGMGLVIRDTLPRRTARYLAREPNPWRQTLPIRAQTIFQTTYYPKTDGSTWLAALSQRYRYLPGLRRLGSTKKERWLVDQHIACPETEGNIVTLAEPLEEIDNGLYLEPPLSKASTSGLSWRYLDSRLKNVLKVVIGFIPAFLTFALSKDWWFLAYFGAVIWFAITGIRNIIQSVIGGGGFARSPMLKWNDYVSWDRLTDSLLFTGFSVPLLDIIVKEIILDRYLGINITTNSNVLYAVMALANGLYLSCHNALRGLPRGAVYGNLFRSILSTPLAILFNSIISGVLSMVGVPAINDVLQKWAAVISKAASDSVAGFIEGAADRIENIRVRRIDYQSKFEQLFDSYFRLEIMFPETDILDLIKSPKKLLRSIDSEAQDLEKLIIVNALDMMYFWLYQPHAQSVLLEFLKSMTPEERDLLAGSQLVLKRNREISQMFIDGLVGKKFSKPLALYLDRSQPYLDEIHKLVSQD